MAEVVRIGLEGLKTIARQNNRTYAQKATVDLLQSQIQDLEIPGKVSQLENDVNFQTETEVAAAIAGASHLKRTIVSAVEEIDASAEGADTYIYMVQKTGSQEDDLYDEYMVLDGAVERIGSTRVDLSSLVEKEEGKGLSSNDFTDEDKAKLDGMRKATEEEILAVLAEAMTEEAE